MLNLAFEALEFECLPTQNAFRGSGTACRTFQLAGPGVHSKFPRLRTSSFERARGDWAVARGRAASAAARRAEDGRARLVGTFSRLGHVRLKIALESSKVYDMSLSLYCVSSLPFREVYF